MQPDSTPHDAALNALGIDREKHQRRVDKLVERNEAMPFREYRLCVEHADGRVVYKPLPSKISKSAAFTHAANYLLGKNGITVSVESRVVSAWHCESIGVEG